MKKNILLFSLSMLFFALLVSCEKDIEEPVGEPDPQDTTTTDTTDNEPKTDYAAIIIGKWEIADATGAGNPDPSSTGKWLWFKEDGSYRFNGSFTGSWQYVEDDHTVFVDGSTQYENTWEIEQLDEEHFIVTFKSPWDGGTPLRWDMIPIP